MTVAAGRRSDDEQVAEVAGVARIDVGGEDRDADEREADEVGEAREPGKDARRDEAMLERRRDLRRGDVERRAPGGKWRWPAASALPLAPNEPLVSVIAMASNRLKSPRRRGDSQRPKNQFYPIL